MIFYRYILTKDGVPMSADLRQKRVKKDDPFSAKIRDESFTCSEFCRNNLPVTLRFYIVELEENFMMMSVIYNGELKDINKIDGYVNDFVLHMNLDFLISSKQEVTLSGFLIDIDRANDFNFVQNAREIKDKYDLNIYGNWFRDNLFKLKPKTKEELLKEADDIVVDNALKEEVERIFIPKAEDGFGVPIHYMVNVRDEKDCEKIVDILLNALKTNNRTVRDIYSTIDLFSYGRLESVGESALNKIFNLNKGGVIIIKSRLKIRDDDHYSLDMDVINMICRQIDFSADDITIILCCIGKNQSQITAYQNGLTDLSFLEISDTILTNDLAKQYLVKLAKNDNINNISGLTQFIEKDISYNTLDLKQLFYKWHKDYVRTIQYPQYSKFVGKEFKEKLEEKKTVAYDDLNNLIGLDGVKEIVNNYLNYARLQKACIENGQKVQNTCRHMCFVGNPGTAKTTVARIIARVMKDNGLLSKGDLIEVGRADIVSRYVGGTAPNVQDIFKKAMGNVLFIDEAYSLNDGKSGLYGDEAINAIVQEMENRREDLVVIFAGYKKEMQDFLDKNSGLRSRIAYEIEFPDYSEDELMQIANFQAKSFDVDISKCEDKIKEIISIGKNNKNFGNGRFIRSMLEKARMKQASRLVNEDKLYGEYIKILEPEDFEIPQVNTRKQLGFC